MKNQIIAAFAAIVTLTLTTSAAFADVGHKTGAPAKSEEKKETVKPYPLNTCIVSGDKLGQMGKPVVFVYKGQEIKLCCEDCREDFDKNPKKFLKKLPKQ